ncbi:miniconductance mechanosensitive channel MscM [Motilimonas sp. 1_MG-2023]|uniref:miniconductance mechanosensitive channel MscM n=1 Tax=Motilimonas sp. 1_MG-2023 TaxID=3062672 RepID=UPI0026E19B2A|nr:miniconductance mechanosensitive channel MscM [Motilimonas sp. 1_MG-2023]MDO6524267.1 miniconductance mechanosensitive channel MscM [Motilimonas sp. 1_MG-2023]
MKSLFVSLLLCLTLISNAFAASPDKALLQDKLDALASEPESSEKLSLQDAYQKTIDYLEQAETFSSKARQYQKVMDDFPYQSNLLQKQIDEFKPEQYADPSNWSKTALEEELAMRTSQLSGLKRKQLDKQLQAEEIEHQLSGFQPKIDTLRNELVSLQHKLDIQKFSAQDDPISQALLVQSQVHEAALSNQILALELGQLSASNRNELYRLESTLLNQKITALQEYSITLQQGLSNIRKQATEDAIAKGEKIAQNTQITSPLLQMLLEENQGYSEQLNALTQDMEVTLQTQTQVAKQMEEINNAVSNIREQVEWLKVSNAFGENLRARLTQLPNPPPLEAAEQTIVEARLAKYAYQQALDPLQHLNEAASTFLEDSKETLSSTEQNDLHALLGVRKQLLTQLLSVSENYIYEQAKLKVAYSQMSSKLGQIRDIASQYLFWTPNTKAININFIADTLASIAWLFATNNTQQIPFAIQEAVSEYWLLYIVGFSLLLYCWYLSNRFFRPYLKSSADQVGKVTRDKFSYTFNNVLLSALLALPVPLLIGSMAFLLDSSWQYPFAQNIGYALYPFAIGLWCFLLVKNMARKNGLFIAHFKWAPQRVEQNFSYIRTMAFIALPCLGFYNFTTGFEELVVYSSLGRLAFITLNLSLAWFYWQIYQEKLPLTYKNKNRKDPHLLHHVLWPILAISPIVNVLATLMGYFYTAHALLKQVQFSVLVGMVFLLSYFLIHRWMFIQKRRLAFDRAKAKRAEILAQREKEDQGDSGKNEGILENIEDTVIDLETISAQSLGLLRTVLTLSYTLLLIYLWAQIYSAFSFLEGVTIWSSSSSINGIDTLNPVNLQDVIFAVFSISIMFVVVKNLPGALELLVLQHFDLAPGTGFAITTLTKYIVILVGVLVGCAFLGVDWSKTQWLVAALTVGLGFGLQEIFANFVSGLIILFEKPIRIGDTVTIRDLTGTIAKIKTRATTIIDWDRKEIIVPNKAFITEQFINWSLSDPITRVITKVGVAYGSNTQQVTRELYAAINDCTLVLETPAPEVFFVGFGDSTLNFETRVYVNEMAHRMPMAHELYSAINTRFKAAGIIIDYPQLDIHIKDGMPDFDQKNKPMFS